MKWNSPGPEAVVDTSDKMSIYEEAKQIEK